MPTRRVRWSHALAEGTATAGVFFGRGALEVVGDDGAGGLVVSGTLRPVLGALVCHHAARAGAPG